MEDTFKIPAVPQSEPTPDESTTTQAVEAKEAPQRAFIKPELPSANFAAPVRHKSLQYKVPESSGNPPVEYTLEVLRNGSIIDYVPLSNRAYTVFGRAPDSDVVLEHPTISRYHAIVQYKSEFEHGQPPGLYLYDCGSTHGTFINKKRLDPKAYVRIKIGFIIKFGQSTRLYLVQGDGAAQAADSSTADDVTHEQMKQFHAKRAKALASVRAKRENAANEASDANVEMDWGMGSEADDAAPEGAAVAQTKIVPDVDPGRKDEENKRRAAADDLQNRVAYQQARNDKAVLKDIMSRVDLPTEEEEGEAKKEPFYLKDPKRALTAFFEREGAELVYDVEDHQFGSYRCTIKLPIVDEYGRAVQAECEKKHCKRKEIIHECILEACRILDEQGVLREGTAASSLYTPRVQQIKRQMLEENDFYEEDEDTFYDRTGELEKKRLKRMEWSGHLNNEQQVETFESLSLKLTNLYKEQVDLEQKLEAAKQMEENAAKNAPKTERDIDEVDLYIRQLKQGEKLNLKVKWQWRKRLLEIDNEERPLVKLLKVCKPKAFDFPAWRLQTRDEAKQNLTSKPILVRPPPSLPSPPKSVRESKSTAEPEEMPPPPAPALPPSTASTPAEPEPAPSAPPPPPPPPPPLSKAAPVQAAHSTSTRRKAPRSTKSGKDQYDDSDHYSEDKFAGWMPPENEQTGDGRTALNDKYGY